MIREVASTAAAAGEVHAHGSELRVAQAEQSSMCALAGPALRYAVRECSAIIARPRLTLHAPRRQHRCDRTSDPRAHHTEERHGIPERILHCVGARQGRALLVDRETRKVLGRDRVLRRDGVVDHAILPHLPPLAHLQSGERMMIDGVRRAGSMLTPTSDVVYSHPAIKNKSVY